MAANNSLFGLIFHRLKRTLAALGLIFLPLMSFAFQFELNGQFQQGGMVVGKVKGAKSVYFGDILLKLSSQGDFVFGFGRDFPASAQLKFELENGKVLIEPIDIKAREYNVQRVEGISKKIMAKDKPAKTIVRIKQEIVQVKVARAKHIESLSFKSDFIWPLESRISGVYGSQRYYNGVPGRPHYGVDMAAPVGTVVVAPADAVVTMIHANMYYSGGTLIMDHGFGVSSSFLHLNEILVNEGDIVKQGQVVAKVGVGGRSTGPHLDWRMNWYKQRIDPALLVPPMVSH